MHDRPRLRGECVLEPRPCPFVGCRYHLALDVTEAGGIRWSHPGAELEQLEETCALDVAEKRLVVGSPQYHRPHRSAHITLHRVGQLLGLTRERVRQIEARALAKLDALKAYR